MGYHYDQSWRDNWPNLSTYLSSHRRCVGSIYTTNTIEGFNRQLRKVTKSNTVFQADDSLFNAVSGDGGHYEKVNRAASELELDSRPVGSVKHTPG